jgi:hypothetical protein
MKLKNMLTLSLLAIALVLGGCNLGGDNCDCPKFGDNGQDSNNTTASVVSSLDSF